eukprot:TRINITY_DN22067_c0_g1_i1.p4 TRINITY_DN22067_c0_g1~~TRINITY_DN22067_c0_g1_i1.p4  ORF type:complete len:214 (+),score=18.94 TRINITY_DN22067_c0_g1_i1:523-1164(+)
MRYGLRSALRVGPLVWEAGCKPVYGCTTSRGGQGVPWASRERAVPRDVSRRCGATHAAAAGRTRTPDTDGTSSVGHTCPRITDGQAPAATAVARWNASTGDGCHEDEDRRRRRRRYRRRWCDGDDDGVDEERDGEDRPEDDAGDDPADGRQSARRLASSSAASPSVLLTLALSRLSWPQTSSCPRASSVVPVSLGRVSVPSVPGRLALLLASG